MLLLQPRREWFEVADVVTDRQVRQRRLRCSLRRGVGLPASLRLQVGDVALYQTAVEVLQPALPHRLGPARESSELIRVALDGLGLEIAHFEVI